VLRKSVKEFTQSQRTLKVKKAETMSSEAEDRDKILAERYSTMSNARLEGETFEEYKERRRATNYAIRQHLKGNRL
jgi:hypothetical protein